MARKKRFEGLFSKQLDDTIDPSGTGHLQEEMKSFEGQYAFENEWHLIWSRSLERKYKKTSLQDITRDEKKQVREILRIANRKRQSRGFLNPREYLKIAAVVALLLVTSLVFYQVTQDHSTSHTWQAGLSRETGNAERMRIRANDGSSILLNSASQVQLSAGYGKKNRELKFQGEAYFEVQKDSTRPFVVETSHLKVIVLGTSFCIKDYPGEQSVKITVLTGKVEVKTGDGHEEKSYLLGANEQLVLDCKQRSAKVTITNPANSIAWTNNVLSFDQTPLSEVIRTLERWYDVKIKVDEQQVENWQVTGEHNNDNLWSVLEAIQFSHGLNYRLERDTIHLFRQKK